MKLYQLTIKPLTPFGTPLKGDTIFGHLCWQAAYDSGLLVGGLERWIEKYDTDPFAVCSSAFPLLVEEEVGVNIALPRPQLPLSLLEVTSSKVKRSIRMAVRKKMKKKKWLLVKEDLKLQLQPEFLLTDAELFSRCYANLPADLRRSYSTESEKKLFLVDHQAHNSIDRLTGTTGSGDGFAPYSCENITWSPGTELVVFCLINEEALDEDHLRTMFERIGQFGFGRDAATGLGRFELVDCELQGLPINDRANACFTLSPSVPEVDLYSHKYFLPFTRFGRHGDRLAHSLNPFKAPVVMADEGAVFIPGSSDVFSRPYLGCAVHDVSLVQPQAVAQGYAIYLPMEVAS